MSTSSHLENLALEAEDFDEDVSVELLATIEEVSPEAYQKIKDESGYKNESGYNDLIG